MLTDKEGNEIRYIKLKDLCRLCTCNKYKRPDDYKGQSLFSQVCSNKAPSSNGLTLNDKCPIWRTLPEIMGIDNLTMQIKEQD